MRRIGIRLRVTLAFAAIMALLLAATGLFLYLRLRADLDRSIAEDLHARSAQLVSLIRTGEARLGEPVRSVLRRRDEAFAQVLNARGGLYDPAAQPHDPPALAGADLARARRGPLTIDRSGVPGMGGEPARLLATPIRFERHRLVVVVGTSLAQREEALGSLARLLATGGPIALVLASLAAYAAVSAALRPVEAMRRRAATISGARSGERLPRPAARDELGRLAETLNAMLERLEAAIERERRLVDDASHELRTPLAVQKAELELALRHASTPAELRAAIASAAEEADRLIALAEDLLVVARAEQGELPLSPERLGAGELLAAAARRAPGPKGPIAVEAADGLAVRADRTRAEQALANLVDNALHHGSGEIRLFARRAGGMVALHVCDRGPGFAPAFLPHAFERFSRGDPARGGGGAGLGLAIVEVIARAHGGRAGVRNREGGGADAWIELPAAG